MALSCLAICIFLAAKNKKGIITASGIRRRRRYRRCGGVGRRRSRTFCRRRSRRRGFCSGSGFSGLRFCRVLYFLRSRT